MEHLGVLLEVVVALGGALVFGLLAARLGQSPIVGYLLAGVLVGPGVLSVLDQQAEVRFLAELGVALLLFAIGLEFSWSRLRSLGPVALIGGTAQIGVTAALGTLGAVALGSDLAGGIVIGMILALSSTAVVFRVLAERSEIDSVPGRVSVGILLMQDMAVIPAVLLVPLLAGAGQGGALAQLGAVLLRGGLLILGMIAVARLVLPAFFETAALKSRELFIILGLTFCLAATWAAAAWGLSPVLGAFVAGMLLADSRYANQIRSDIGPLRAGFVALFFVSIGMLADPAWILARAPVVAAAVGVIVVGKGLVTGLVVRSFRHTTATALISGLTLAHIGELSFVLADLGRIHELIGVETFQLIVSASVVSLLLTPYLIAGSQRVRGVMTRQAAGRGEVGPAAVGSDAHHREAEGHVIVVGYGPTGVRVVDALQEVGTPHVVIEMNPRTVDRARARGLEMEFGDATREEILLEAGIANALALIVTVPDPGTAISVVETAKSLRSDLPVVARARWGKYARRLADVGADVLANEEEMMGEKLADLSLRVVGIASQAVARIHRTAMSNVE